jgi:hypothetical protein
MMQAVSNDYTEFRQLVEDNCVEREAREASLAAKVVAAYSMSLLNSHSDLSAFRPEIERALDRLNEVVRRMDDAA